MVGKLLVIGLDGGTFDNITPWAEEGHLPNIKKLMDEGAHGTLQSTMPPITVPSWPCSYTGKNPGKIGVYGFVTPKTGSYNFPIVRSTDIQGDTIWDVLGTQNKKSIILNCPVTYPPQPINGVMVSGMFAPNTTKEFTYPPELKEELDKVCDGYQLCNNEQLYKYAKDHKDLFKSIIEVTRKRWTAATYLMEKYEWALFMVVFSSTDWIQHFGWTYIDREDPNYNSQNSKEHREIILSFFKLIDEIIGDLIQKAGEETNVVILSDHGFGKLKGHFHINDWLIQEGYLHLTKKGKFKKSLFRDKLGINKEQILDLLTKLKLRGLVKFIPKRINNMVPRKHGLSSIESAKEDGTINWELTSAWSEGEGIFINLKDKYPNGSVGNHEYESLRNQIKEKLENISGYDVKAFKKEKIYSGDYLDAFPDLILNVEDMAYPVLSNIGNEKIFTLQGEDMLRNGYHRSSGMLIMHGPSIQKKEIKGAEIIDIMPTLLHIMDSPIPETVDGKVLPVLKEQREPKFKKERRVQKKIEKATSEDEEMVKNRLKALGYLD